MTALRDARDRRDAPVAPRSWPFAPIEELDFYLENPWEPDLVHLELHALGHLDQAALAAALADALAADPAARRHLVAASRWSRRLRWAAAEPGRYSAPGESAGPLTVAAWSGPAELDAVREQISARPISLTAIAVRLVLAVGPGHDVVFLQTHHAAFDGVSSMALLSAICAAYRDRAGVITRPAGAASAWTFPDPAGSPPPDGPGSAPSPGREAVPGRAAVSGREPAAPGHARAALPGAVARIARHVAHPDRPGYGHVLTSIPVPRPARRGTGPHPTVNDLLVAAMILTVDRWNAAHGRRGGTIRISVPVNARDPQRRWEGPGNISRLLRVTARPGQGDGTGLIEQVAAQTRAGKEQPRAGLDGLSRLLAAGWAPAAVKQRATRLARRLGGPFLGDTSMVSNLGVLPDPPSFSGSGQEPLWFYGPAQMPRGLALGAVTVSGLLHMCLTHSHALLGNAAAADFAGAYCQTLAGLAVGPGNGGPGEGPRHG